MMIDAAVTVVSLLAFAVIVIWAFTRSQEKTDANARLCLDDDEK